MARSSLRLEELSGFMRQELATGYTEYLRNRKLSGDSIKQYVGYIVKILKILKEANKVDFLQTYKDIAELQNLQELGLDYLPKSHHYVWNKFIIFGQNNERTHDSDGDTVSEQEEEEDPSSPLGSFIQELQDEVDKHVRWLPQHLKSVPQSFMKAVKQGFKTGFSGDGETASFLDHSVVALLDLLHTVSHTARHEKSTSLRASLTNIKRTYIAHNLNPDEIESEIESMEEVLIDEEITLSLIKRERFHDLYTKNDNEAKKKKFDADIESHEKTIQELRKKLETVKDLALQERVCKSIIRDIDHEGNLKDKLFAKYHALKNQYAEERGETKE